MSVHPGDPKRTEPLETAKGGPSRRGRWIRLALLVAVLAIVLTTGVPGRGRELRTLFVVAGFALEFSAWLFHRFLGGEARRERRFRLGAAALSGVLYVLAFPGLDQSWLSFVAWVPVVVALGDVDPKRAFFAGWTVGFVSHLGGFYWVTHLLSEFAHAPLVAAVAGCVALCGAQGASFGFGLAAAAFVRGRLGVGWVVALPVGLTVMDFTIPLIFPSFVGNTLHGLLWLMQPAELVGVLGLTTLVGLWNGAIADVVSARRAGGAWPVRTIVVGAGSLVLVAGFGAWRVAGVDAMQAAARKLKVGVAQANVGGAENLSGAEESHARHLAQTDELHSLGAELVVWPEGAFRGYVDVGQDASKRVLGGVRQPLLFGALRSDRDPVTGRRVPFNSAFLTDANGRVTGAYDKMVLLAFGEYVPGLEYVPWITKFLPYTSVFGRGTSTAPLRLGDIRLGTIICYEDIVPSHVRAIMGAGSEGRPHLLVNITNDSWYGDTSEPPIHLAEAVFRTIEHRRALVRSTNTGISAIVDAAGRVVSQTPTYRQATLLEEVPLLHGETAYMRVGDLVGWLALAVMAVAALAPKLRRRSPA